MGSLYYKGDHVSALRSSFPTQNCVAYHFPDMLEHFDRSCPKKKKAAKAAALSSIVEACRQLVGFGVVLVFVNTLAHVIGFTIELSLILLRQMAVVLGHILLLVILQPLFPAL